MKKVIYKIKFSVALVLLENDSSIDLIDSNNNSLIKREDKIKAIEFIIYVYINLLFSNK